MIISCPAKINLYLDIPGRRPDGYHDIVTVMQAIDLYDELLLEARGGGEITMECDAAGLPVDRRNLCVRAAEAMRRLAAPGGGVRIALKKRIPIAAGLGGGSSDAAGVILGLNRLWEMGLGQAALEEISAGLGSDVPFFISGGTARCTGRGESISPLPGAPRLAYVLVTPPIAVSTAGVYAALDAGGKAKAPDEAGFLRAIELGDPRRVSRRLYNRLEDAPGPHRGEVDRLKALLLARGALGACMSGSGSSVFGLAADIEAARRLARAIGGEIGKGAFLHFGLTNVPVE
jgi:4-diphosphocytidyl-2-C-methyl-D-erythritol kinase